MKPARKWAPKILIPTALLLVIALSGYRPAKPTSPAGKLISFSGTGLKTFDRPMAVAFGQDRLFVADGLKSTITALDGDGKFLSSFSSLPRLSKIGRGYPAGIAIGSGDRLYVADLWNEDVWVFTTRGRFLWSLKGRGARFGRPGAVAFARDKLYVSDLADQTLKEFSPSGKLSAVYGGPGSARGRFAYITGIAIGPSGQIYVADSYNRRVQVFSPRGAYLRNLVPPKGFAYALPRALTVDAQGRVYVMDAFRKIGLAFDSSGRYLESFRAAEGSSAMPNGVAVDNLTNRVFVTDKLLGTVSIWRLSE